MTGEPLLGYASRNQIREVLADYSVERIKRYFKLGDFIPDTEVHPVSADQARQLVERYYAAIDFSSEENVERFFVVLEEVLHDLQPVASPRPWQHPTDLAEEHFGRLVRFLARDGIEVVEGRLRTARGIVGGAEPTGVSSISEAAIQEHVRLAKRRMHDGDYPGAITVSYTLVESFLKALSGRMEIEVKDSQGDIRALYGALKGALGLDPAPAGIERFLKAILGGLQSQIGGLYELANKASDRHDRVFDPKRHHAQLAVNTAFTLCEFLLGTYENRQDESN